LLAQLPLPGNRLFFGCGAKPTAELPSLPIGLAIIRDMKSLCLLAALPLLAIAPCPARAQDAAHDVEKGDAALDIQDYDQAVLEYSEAIRLDATIAPAYNNRGNVFARMGEYDRAIADYDQAIRLNPNLAPPRNNRGNAYLAKHDLARAIADFDEAIRLDPQFAQPHLNRGNAHNDQGDYDRAVADFGDAIRLNPNYFEAYISLARVLATCPDGRMRDGGKAVEYARRACELTQWELPAALDALASADAEAGYFDEAVKWETKVLEFRLSKADADETAGRLSLYRRKIPYHAEAKDAPAAAPRAALSKAEWLRRVSAHASVYPNGYIMTTKTAIDADVGPPADEQLAGDRYIIRWACSDGDVRITCSRVYYGTDTINGVMNQN
jgi:tetratricopeptide (TPR) repeat protein